MENVAINEQVVNTSTATPNPADNAENVSATTAPQSEAQQVASPANVSSDPGVSQDEPVGTIDPAKKQELEEKFQSLINTPRYWENANRIKRLEEALVLPVYDDKSLQQFFNSAKDELLALEFKKAMQEKRVPVEPTMEQIMALAEQKYHEKYVLEPQRKAERDAKKKLKVA